MISWRKQLLTVLPILSLVLLLIGIVLQQSNKSLNKKFRERQRFIESSIRLSQVNNQLITWLAQLASAGSDLEIRALLNANGITFNYKPAEKEEPPNPKTPIPKRE